ncbi:MAG: glycosyltransferase family 2 protein [Planctomycetaceae bacterium]|nr:glycosyltransferase family 2 protein [Planctomycetaceae bacterium]
MKLSVVIPAYNEQENIGPCLQELTAVLNGPEPIPHEIIVVDDNSRDGTADVVRAFQQAHPQVRLVRRQPPGGFGRAIRAGLAAVQGDVVVVYMADLSDDPQDVVLYYRKICEGYDCVYGSRFVRGSRVEQYPWFKLFVNRIVNTGIRWLFWTRFNDLTNAFKAYRTEVIRACGPYTACHFNITLEMSLGALNRDYRIIQVPISWYGRKWGSTNLRLKEMGRRYLATLLMTYGQRLLIRDDLVAEKHGSQQVTCEPPINEPLPCCSRESNPPVSSSLSAI